MCIEPQVGEVWFAELGLAAKSRPVLVLAYPQGSEARALVIVAPLTSQIRGMKGEVDLGHPKWLTKPSAVNIQGLASFDRNKLIRRMGFLDAAKLKQVKEELKELLELD